MFGFGWRVVVCTERGISRLVYTSTVNVAFAGRPIEDGDENSVPCVPLDMVRYDLCCIQTVFEVHMLVHQEVCSKLRLVF